LENWSMSNRPTLRWTTPFVERLRELGLFLMEIVNGGKGGDRSDCSV